MNCSRQSGADTMTMPLLKYFGWLGSFAPAENAWPKPSRKVKKARQRPIAVERHDPAEAFAEMGRETVEDCLQAPCLADQNPESDAPPKRQAALLRSYPGLSTAAKAFTAPNPFHKLPRKS